MAFTPSGGAGVPADGVVQRAYRALFLRRAYRLSVLWRSAAGPTLVHGVPGRAGDGALYYVLFTFAIRRWNLLTPGREVEETAVTQENEQNDTVSGIILAYGGLGNMTSIEACMSRLRIDVTDKTLVDKALLKQLGAAGVVEVGNNIQSVFGMKSDRLKEAIRAANAYTQEAK